MQRLFLLLFISLVPPSLAVREQYLHRRFQNQVDEALRRVESVLDTTRHPVAPEDTDHTYDDKYALVDVMTNTFIASCVAVIQKLGLTDDSFERVLNLVHEKQKPITLWFHMDKTCTFDKQTERKVVVAEQEVETSNDGSGLVGRLTKQTKTVKVKETIQEYHFNVATSYRFYLKLGDDEEIELSRDNIERTVTVVGGRKRPPAPDSSSISDYEVNLTWLFQKIVLKEGGKIQPLSDFSIDRLDETCKTPRRNQQVEKAVRFEIELFNWVGSVLGHFPFEKKVLAESLSKKEVFSPIIPLFEDSSVLPQSDLDLFLTKHSRSLDELTEKTKSDPSLNDDPKSHNELRNLFLLYNLRNLGNEWADSVEYVESMLERQLVNAIGKVLGKDDFEEFIRFYSKKIFEAQYVPKPFSYAVRRGDSFPDGMVSIEGSKSNRDPARTLVRRVLGETSPPINIPLSAATSIEIQGDRLVHGWIQHRWGSGNSDNNSLLVARAHQFSSFVLGVGIMGGRDEFILKNAIILQNKDEVLIPLLTSVLPSAKEFKDATASLSPEQKDFAEAFRKMQLESSVFGVCIIQIKPQLERLLDLPEGSLTKEIQLTQDLMSLFVEYQIPSDLLSFDGPNNVSTSEKVSTVKGYVKAVLDVIANAKQKQLEDEKQKAKMRKSLENIMLRDDEAMDFDSFDGKAQGYGAQQYGRHQARTVRTTSSVKRKEPIPTPGPSLGSSSSTSPSSSTSTKSSPPQDSSQKYRDTSEPIHESDLDDFTVIPRILDAQFEQHDKGGSLKSTIIKAGQEWDRLRQKNLLVALQETHLHSTEVNSETNKAKDLLTAISRSGSLPIESSELHVVVAVSHCFEKEIMETIIEDNINPVDKFERSMLMIGSIIHGVPETDLAIGGGLVVEEKKEEIQNSKEEQSTEDIE